MAESLSGLGALVDFVGETKPYHTKLLDIGVGYQYDDNLIVNIGDALNTHITIDSSWCIDTFSNGVNRRFRIPNTYVPRFSNWSHGQYKYTGVTDEFAPGVYKIPFNNAALVKVNGVEYTEGVEFDIQYPGGSTLTFNPTYEPLAGDLIEVNAVTIDWLYFSFDGVYQNYTLQGYDPVLQKLDLSEYSFIVNSWDVGGWDNFPWDELQDDVEYTTEVEFAPIGKLIQDVDEYGTYSVFEFYDTALPSAGVEIKICNQQSWGHHSTAFVKLTEEVKMGTSLVGSEDMIIDINSANVSDTWDNYPWDTTGWDESRKMFIIEEHLNEPQTGSIASVGITDDATITVTLINISVAWLPGDNFSLSNNDLTVTHTAGEEQSEMVYANQARDSGQYYYELLVTSAFAGTSTDGIGVIPTNQTDFDNTIGSFSVLGGGVLYNGAAYIKGSYMPNYFATDINNGDVVGVKCDFTTNQIYFSLNGVEGAAIAFDFSSDSGSWLPAFNTNTFGGSTYIHTGRFTNSSISNLPAGYTSWEGS